MKINIDTNYKPTNTLDMAQYFEMEQSYFKMRDVSKKDTFEKSGEAAVLPSENYLDYSKVCVRSSSVLGNTLGDFIFSNPIYKSFYTGEADMEDVKSSMKADICMLVDFELYSSPEASISDERKEKIVGGVLLEYQSRLCSWGVAQCYSEGKALCGHREFAYYSSEIYHQYRDVCENLLSYANEISKEIVGKDCDYTSFSSGDETVGTDNFKKFWNNKFGTNMKQAKITKDLNELPENFTFFFEARAYGRSAGEGKGEFGRLQIKLGKEVYKVDVPFCTAFPYSRLHFSMLELLRQYDFAKEKGKYDFLSGIHLYHSPFYSKEVLKTPDNISV